MSAHFVCGPGLTVRAIGLVAVPETIIGHRKFRARIGVGVPAGWKQMEVHAEWV
jgi:hypothetical protein